MADVNLIVGLNGIGGAATEGVLSFELTTLVRLAPLLIEQVRLLSTQRTVLAKHEQLERASVINCIQYLATDVHLASVLRISYVTHRLSVRLLLRLR